MTSGARAELRRVLCSRREPLADAWYEVVKSHSLAFYEREHARDILSSLAERATSLLCDRQVSRSEAQALGAALTDFRLGPEGWGGVEEALTRELASGLPAEMVALLQARLNVLRSNMATGFLRGTGAAILRQQEQIRQAHIDALERTERELRIRDAAIASSVTAIALWTLEGRITYVNPAFLTMWDYNSEEEALGTHIRDLWAEGQPLPNIRASLEQIGGWIGKLTGKRSDGSHFTVLVSASVAVDAQGNPVRLMGSFVDMTYRDRVGQMLSARIHRLEILHKIDQAILEARSPREIMAAGLEGITRLLPCKYASVTSCDFDAQALVLEAAVSSDGSATREPGDCYPMAGFERQLRQLQRGQEVVIEDLKAHPWCPEAREVLESGGVRSLIAVPIKAKGEMSGYLCLSAESPGALGRSAIPVAQELADSLAVAIQHAQLHQSLEQKSQRLRAMMTRLAEAEENERHRVAQVLHDRIGQNLTALGLSLNLVRSQIEPLASQALLSRLDDSLALVEETTERTRLVMTDLRPPMLADYGLVATLRWYGELFTSRTGIAVKVLCERQPEGETPSRLPDRVERALFRIAQEALTNAARHASATAVSVTLALNGGAAQLTIEDNGMGFDRSSSDPRQQARNWGLLTMAERAEAVGGHCHVESRPEEGTRVTVEVQR